MMYGGFRQIRERWGFDLLQRGALEYGRGTLCTTEEWKDRLLAHLRAATACASQIEFLMFCALGWMAHEKSDVGKYRVTPQLEVGRRRIDIAVEYASYDGVYIQLAVECDGHEFHNATFEQAQSDRARDRELLGYGWTTIRFTGSEIVRNPAAAADEVYGAVSALYNVARGQIERGIEVAKAVAA